MKQNDDAERPEQAPVCPHLGRNSRDPVLLGYVSGLLPHQSPAPHSTPHERLQGTTVLLAFYFRITEGPPAPTDTTSGLWLKGQALVCSASLLP